MNSCFTIEKISSLIKFIIIKVFYVFQVDYFDESLFDIGYQQTSSDRSSIPVTLGSISGGSLTDSRSASFRDNQSWSDVDMPRNVTSSLRKYRAEPKYMNTNSEKSQINNSDIYCERTEGHYARLTEINEKVGQIKRFSTDNSRDGLNFYVQKAAEQRARSRSRGPERTRGRSRSNRRSEQPRSRSRGCSASRDIMALYTNRPVSGVKLRTESSSAERETSSTLRRRQSISPESRSEHPTKGKSAIDIKTNSHRNKGIKSPDTNQHRHSPRDSKSTSNNTSFMTLLEMDSEKNAQIERDLLAANSLKPAQIKMMMIANHKPSNGWVAKDEISVKAGEIVTGFYKQNEWLYVQTDQKQLGFVPFAFTKPVKVTRIQHITKLESKTLPPPPTTTSKPITATPTAPKPVTGILKTSNQTRQKTRRSHPKYSVKVRTQADNDSLSSETSSLMMDDFVYTRKKPGVSSVRADCIVIDTDDMCKFEPSANNGEETGTYCSDSGISDPNSNNSDDLDPLHSPVSLPDDTNDSGINVPISTPRLPNERIVSVTTELLASTPQNSGKINNRQFESKNRYQTATPISDMPLGPLGARLAKLNLEKSEKKPEIKTDNIVSKPTRTLASDMKERAQSSSSTPTSLRPEIPKDYGGPRVTVVFDYDGGNEDDLVVHASDIVTVLNGEDIEWIWVQRRDGKEGFIPKEYVIPLELSAHNRRRVGISLL